MASTEVRGRIGEGKITIEDWQQRLLREIAAAKEPGRTHRILFVVDSVPSARQDEPPPTARE